MFFFDYQECRGSRCLAGGKNRRNRPWLVSQYFGVAWWRLDGLSCCPKKDHSVSRDAITRRYALANLLKWPSFASIYFVLEYREKDKVVGGVADKHFLLHGPALWAFQSTPSVISRFSLSTTMDDLLVR